MSTIKVTNLKNENFAGDQLYFKSDGKIGIGTADPSHPLHVKSTTSDLLQLDCNDAGALGAHLKLNHDSSSPADDDVVGAIEFNGKDSNGNPTIYSRIRGVALDVTDGSEDGALVFGTRVDASFGERMRINGGDVGIARTNPSYRLHIHTAPTNSTQVTGLCIANDGSSTGVGGKINLGAANGYDSTSAGISGWYDGTGTSLSLFTTASYASTGHVERLRMQSDGNVGIARTVNNQQTSSLASQCNLSINRESDASSYAAGLNKSLNVDNHYAVSTFRSTNTNRNGTTGWMDVAKFWAWDMNAKVIIQAGGTFTGDQVEIRVISSYNSALNNGYSGPYLEVKRTEGHTGGRFTKVRIGCHNSNRQPVLQVYFVGTATHNSAGTVNVTCHDYGSNYGGGSYRGEPRFQSATTLNETWKELDIDSTYENYFNTSTTPAFSSYKADNAGQISSGTYAFNSQILDRGGDNYNTSNGRFTAPCDGVYYFIATLQMYGGSSSVHARFQKNGTDIWNSGTNTPYYDEKHSTHANLQPFVLVELSTDDYVECVRSGSTRGMQSAMIGFLVR